MPKTNPKEWKSLIKPLVLVLVIVACLVVVYATPLRHYLDTDHIPRWRAMIRKAGAWGPILFVLVGAVVVGAGFPRIGYNVIGGAAFGFVMGSVWSQLGTIIGTMGCFWLARTLGREWVERKWGHRFGRLEKHMQERGFVIVLLVRLCPVGNNFATTCLAAVSSVGTGAFFLASFVGMLPQTIVYSLIGSGIAKGQHGQTAIGLVLLAVVSVIFWFVYRYSRLASSVAKEVAEGEETEDITQKNSARSQES